MNWNSVACLSADERGVCAGAADDGGGGEGRVVARVGRDGHVPLAQRHPAVRGRTYRAAKNELIKFDSSVVSREK